MYKFKVNNKLIVSYLLGFSQRFHSKGWPTNYQTAEKGSLVHISISLK